MSVGTRKMRLTGWGMTEPTVADVAEPRSADEVAGLVKGANAAGVIARGLGRSYNNAAQNERRARAVDVAHARRAVL